MVNGSKGKRKRRHKLGGTVSPAERRWGNERTGVRRNRRDVHKHKCAFMSNFSRFRVVREKKSLPRPSRDSLQGKYPELSRIAHSSEGDNDVQPD